tara:strand:+ start:1574 stop:2434 length:861 start_codon:yes stop_codon:yes gene_type:complete
VNSFEDYTNAFRKLITEGRSIPLAEGNAAERGKPNADAPIALLLSPHPDDEVIIGGLPLRLMRESGWRVINVAVTLGSKLERREERWEELARCCEAIGFELVATQNGGLNSINPESRDSDPDTWSKNVAIVAGVIQRFQPAAIFLPHREDWNITHIGTHLLGVDALKTIGTDFTCEFIETEFWRPMSAPNLVVESSSTDLGDLLAALSFHVGEITRNPYHLTVPAWMIDNVRRGAEVVGGQGKSGPPMDFATLYQVLHWNGEELTSALEGGRFVTQNEDPATVLKS